MLLINKASKESVRIFSEIFIEGNWKEEVLSNTDKEPIFILIGNKTDLKERREVALTEAVAWCEANDNIPYFETRYINSCWHLKD